LKNIDNPKLNGLSSISKKMSRNRKIILKATGGLLFGQAVKATFNIKSDNLNLSHLSLSYGDLT